MSKRHILCGRSLPPERILHEPIAHRLCARSTSTDTLAATLRTNCYTKKSIRALQEYIGYCLLPVAKAQKMLLMVGKGGEEKSRIGLILRGLFGSSMYTGSLQKVETNRFARADLGTSCFGER